MKFSVNWLREFVDLPANSDALADLLTMSGIEIEAIETRGADVAEVVVAQITDSKQHPNADRLTVCAVADGSSRMRQIVCGAKNYKIGDKVPLAFPGAELPGGLKIRASKLRGVESEGMLCSGKELGLSEDAAGLLILPSDAKLGAPIRELFPADTILDVEITPNRGDLLSHYGLARDIAALTGSAVRSPREAQPPGARAGSIEISARRECLFFSARRINNVKVGPSPSWLRAKIESVGIRSINNIVDISNFVMLELGQPTHAFDADKVRGGIDLRLARAGEEFLALDGRTYKLKSSHLVVADAERAIGIAGVMGGEETGVTHATHSILLESAYFLPASVRRTARDLTLSSDASYRFERGVDPEMVLRGSQRATELICEIAEGTAVEGIETAGELPASPPNVPLRYDRLDRLVGIHIEPRAVNEILQRLGLKNGDQTSWKIPSYRRDLQREVDLIEEVVRVTGVQQIPTVDRSRFTPATTADRRYDFEAKLRRQLAALGLSEVRTSSLISRREINRGHRAIELRNPLSEDHVALRPSLVPGLMDVLSRNCRAGSESIALFELGNIFSPEDAKQTRALAIAVSGRVIANENWRADKMRRFDFFDLKGFLEALAPATENGGYAFRRTEQRTFSLAAEILLGGKRVGICGQLSHSESSALDATAPVLIAQLDLSALAAVAERALSFHEIDRYPAIRRDVAMFVASDVTHEQVLQAISSADEPLLQRIELFDLFTDQPASAEMARKSLAYSLTYRDKNRTLTNDEVSTVHARIRERLRSQLGAELRE